MTPCHHYLHGLSNLKINEDSGWCIILMCFLPNLKLLVSNLIFTNWRHHTSPHINPRRNAGEKENPNLKS
jgi:hypothetical protein